jgi:NAD(P)-dependent dehydrogenase (short-subunit alcohol dehydrogenase family)
MIEILWATKALASAGKAISRPKEMKVRTILVTGSTDGIGMQTALQLARLGANVLLHGRDKNKGLHVKEQIIRDTGNPRLELFIADLSSLQAVRRLASEVRQSQKRLHVLINNAGIFMPHRSLTEDGLETTFAVNCLAPFLLTLELLPLLAESAPSKIITVASVAHWNALLEWENLQGERRYDGFQAYALSKLGNILFTYALASRMRGSKITANCLHPGVTKTKLLRLGFGDYPGQPPEEGARTSVYLAFSPQVESVNGKYFERCRPAQSSPLTYDQRVQERFWRRCEELCGKSWPERLKGAS